MDNQKVNDLADLVADAYFGRKSSTNYSRKENLEVFRQALIDLNGSERMTMSDFRRGASNGVFELIETTITRILEEELPASSPIFDFVDYRNLANGDQAEFIIEDPGDFVVSRVTDGTQQVRRQRFTGQERILVETELYVVKIYEELRRVMANQRGSDMVTLVSKVVDSFEKEINIRIAQEVMGAFDELETPYKVTGAYDEGQLITLIDHVEAATGQDAVVLGSAQAVRKIDVTANNAHSAKEDKYNMGYYTHVGMTPVISLRNAHKTGTTDFVLNDTDLYVVAADDKFVKFVNEGESYIIEHAAEENAGLQLEHMMTERFGMAVVFSAECGVYQIA